MSDGGYVQQPYIVHKKAFKVVMIMLGNSLLVGTHSLTHLYVDDDDDDVGKKIC
jgi:hypothetical protein